MIVLYVLGGLGLLWVLVRVEVLRAMDQRAALHEIKLEHLQESLGDLSKRIDTVGHDLRHDMDAADDDLCKDLERANERISSILKELRWFPDLTHRRGV